MNEQAKAALHTIDEKAAYFTAISDAVWDDPELSLKEFHAAALKEYLAMSGKPGTVVFFGCPGEEGGVPIAI